MKNVEFSPEQKQAAANAMAKMVRESMHMLAVMIYADLGVGPGDIADADPMITGGLAGVVVWAAQMGVTEAQLRESFRRFEESNIGPVLAACGSDGIGAPKGHA